MGILLLARAGNVKKKNNDSHISKKDTHFFHIYLDMYLLIYIFFLALALLTKSSKQQKWFGTKF